MTRTLRTIAIFAIIGAVLNVAVAWVIASTSRPPPNPLRSLLGNPLFAYERDRVIISPLRRDVDLFRRTFGWPTDTLCYHYWQGNVSPEMSFRYSWPFAGRRYPLRPMPLGSAVNTATYGGVAWIIASTPAAIRRTRRRLRGLCPYCAYDLTGLNTCPECGR